MTKQEQISIIEELLRVKYQTSFSVSLDKFGCIINVDNYQDFANSVEVEVDSDEFYNLITDIERAVNLLF